VVTKASKKNAFKPSYIAALRAIAIFSISLISNIRLIEEWPPSIDRATTAYKIKELKAPLKKEKSKSRNTEGGSA